MAKVTGRGDGDWRTSVKTNQLTGLNTEGEGWLVVVRGRRRGWKPASARPFSFSLMNAATLRRYSSPWSGSIGRVVVVVVLDVAVVVELDVAVVVELIGRRAASAPLARADQYPGDHVFVT